MRSGGVLMHISSLPSPYGIGTLGACAKHFIDFLYSAGQRYWQVLPVSPTGYGDSPYQSFSSYAGNPYFIDFDTLCRQGFLKVEEFTDIDWGSDPQKVDFGKLYSNRFKVLGYAACRLLAGGSADFNRFCDENSYWLDDYALFMALKDRHGGISWTSWPCDLRFRKADALKRVRRELCEAVNIYKAIQFFFWVQWDEMKAYANKSGIEIIGDIPIYVAPDSADLWAHPKIFQLDENLRVTKVSGCPPDGFTEDGQLWGNPLYDWDVLKKDRYKWWVDRIDHQFKLFDVLRIDHFRGFDSYFAIPGDAKNARNGHWCRGPGLEFFKALGKRRIIAEDLGFMTDSVRSLLKQTGYPGMKVLQFAFDSREESDYLPHNFIKNSVAYIGTHDNSTILGWFNSAPACDVEKAKEYLRIRSGDDVAEAALIALWSSVSYLAVVTMQDLLGLDDSARMNIPGMPGGNWRWRMPQNTDLSGVAQRLHKLSRLYGRENRSAKKPEV